MRIQALNKHELLIKLSVFAETFRTLPTMIKLRIFTHNANDDLNKQIKSKNCR